jgi:hypothetical protein
LIFSTFFATLTLIRKTASSSIASMMRIQQVVDLKDLLEALGSQVSIANGGTTGVGSSLEIASIGPRSLALEGPINFSLRPGEDGFGLVIHWLDERTGVPMSQQVMTSERSVIFSYFSADTQWTPAWTIARRLPALLRVTVADRVGGRSSEFVLRVKPLAPASCAFERIAACELR